MTLSKLVILSFSFVVKMNQALFVLYSETIHFQAERDRRLGGLSALISPYLAKFMKHNKSNTAFLLEIVIIFFPIYVPEATNVISSFNIMTVITVNSRCNNHSINLYHVRGKIYVAFINNADCPNRYYFDGHLSNFKFLVLTSIYKAIVHFCDKFNLKPSIFCISFF